MSAQIDSYIKLEIKFTLKELYLLYNTPLYPVREQKKGPDMDAFPAHVCVSHYGDLAGIRRIEVGCWQGKILSALHDGVAATGLLVAVPRRSARDAWRVVLYKEATLLVSPAVDNPHLYDLRVPVAPLNIFLPPTHNVCQVVNLRELAS